MSERCYTRLTKGNGPACNPWEGATLVEVKGELAALGGQLIERGERAVTGWDAFAKYVGVQGLLALATTGAVIYQLVAQHPVPGEVYGLVGVAWGFYFAKNGVAIAGIGKASKK